METSFRDVTEQTSNDRHHPHRPTPPRPPKPQRSIEKENDPISNGNVTVTTKFSNAKEKPVVPPTNPGEGGNIQLARAGETVLETFYGMLYICEDDTKEWKLAANGFIPLCFIQERGNANKPFKVIAAHGSLRVMEYPVTQETKCTQNKAFVRWHSSQVKMYGVRFTKESQANQFYSAMSRMKSTLLKTAELLKQPERKTVVSQIRDPSTEGVSHTKISLIVKLPSKETTIITVPGLISIGELFDLICKNENLSHKDHHLTLPKVEGKEITYDSHTVLGSLKVKDVSITHNGGSKETSVTTSSPAVHRPLGSNNNKHALPAEKISDSLAQSDEQLNKNKKEAVKVKRRAPPPPQQRPERPTSMPLPRPRTVEPNHGTPSAVPQAKKRQAPARPPAPKISREVDVSVSPDTDERLPPEFYPPPPPDGVPPPLDECEYPVSPLSEEDLHETAWMNSSTEQDVPRMTHMTSIKESNNVVQHQDPPLSPEGVHELQSPETIPLKFLLPSSEAEVENDILMERENQSSRINFVGDSRSSSVDISSDNDLLTSPVMADWKPMDFQEGEEESTFIHSGIHSPPPPPSDFSNEAQLEITSHGSSRDLNLEAVQQDIKINAVPPPLYFSENDDFSKVDVNSHDIESMVVPPPPTMFDDSPHEEDVTFKTSSIQESEGFSIPPPTDFAEEAGYSTETINDEQSTKKRLNLGTEMFPWKSEQMPPLVAETAPTEVKRDATPNPMESLNENILQYTVEMPGQTNRQEHIVEKEVKAVSDVVINKSTDKQITESPDLDMSAPNISEQKNECNNGNASTYKNLVVSENDHLLQKPREKDRRSISSDEDANYKTPFDDLGSIENSESPMASEFEDDFPELKRLKDECQEIPNYTSETPNVNESGKQVSDEPLVESSSATSIAIPVDILLQSLEPKSNSESTSSQSDNQQQSALKRPISSGFKTQSWADIKNQEKRIQQEKQKNSKTAKTNVNNVQIKAIQNEENSSDKLKTSESTVTTEMKPTMNTSSLERKAVEKVSTVEQTTIEKTSSLGRKSTEKPSSAKPFSQEPRRHSTPVNHQQPVLLSAWDEIKYQEKLMEEERERKIAFDKMPASHHVSPLEEIETGVTESAPQVTISESLSSSTAPYKTNHGGPKMPVSYVSSAAERRSASGTSQNLYDNDAAKTVGQTVRPKVEASRDQNQSAVSKTDPHSVQGVVMRKKAGKQHESEEKRKSVHDMMKMFSSEDNPDPERNDSSDVNPRQSPALRLLEEKMGYRERSSSDSSTRIAGTSSKQKTTPRIDDSSVNKSKIVVENNNNKDKFVGDIPPNVDISNNENKKVKQWDSESSGTRLRTNSLNPKPYGVLFPNEQAGYSKVTKPSNSPIETKKETERPQKTSTNKVKPYGVLFPNDQKGLDKSTNPSESNVGLKQQATEGRKIGGLSTFGKKEKPKVAEESIKVENAQKAVELRQKESISDPLKRHSMPVNLMESTSGTSTGTNLKILLAPQISDVNVVPKGRVAAMKAAWKSEDQ